MSAADDLLLSVREISGMVKDVAYVANGDESTKTLNHIDLGADIVYAIAAAYKNGTAMVLDTDYSWATYRSNVKLLTNPALNDSYLFRIKTGMSDTTLQEWVDKAKNETLRSLRAFYATAESIDTQPTFLEIVRDIAAAEIIKSRTMGVALENARFRMASDMLKDAKASIRAIQNGTSEITDSDGAAVDRKAKSVLGGFRHASGTISESSDWWTRLRKYNDAIVRPAGQVDDDTQVTE